MDSLNFSQTIFLCNYLLICMSSSRIRKKIEHTINVLPLSWYWSLHSFSMMCGWILWMRILEKKMQPLWMLLNVESTHLFKKPSKKLTPRFLNSKLKTILYIDVLLICNEFSMCFSKNINKYLKWNCTIIVHHKYLLK